MADKPILFSGPMVRALLAGTKTQTRRIMKPQPSAYAGNPTPPEGRSWVAKSRDEPYFAMHDDQVHWCWWDEYNRQGPDWIKLRIAKGDRLWVREAHALLPRTAYRASVGTGTIEQVEHPTDGYSAAVFREGFDRSGRPLWRPSIHMPRWASRLTLTVTDVRIERLQEISEADAIAEGIEASTAVRGDWQVYAMAPKPFSGAAPTVLSHGRGVVTSDPRHAYATLWTAINGPDSWKTNPWVAAYTFTVHRGNIDQMGAA